MQMTPVRDIFIYKELGQIRRMGAIITNGSATVTELSGTKKREKEFLPLDMVNSEKS